jgi:methionyl aminopeptidase
MHENPQVPNYCNREVRKHDFKLENGLVLAVEPMVNMGRAESETRPDHWTVVTRDGLPSAHVEHTLAVTPEGVRVLTGDEEMLIPRQGA